MYSVLFAFQTENRKSLSRYNESMWGSSAPQFTTAADVFTKAALFYMFTNQRKDVLLFPGFKLLNNAT